MKNLVILTTIITVVSNFSLEAAVAHPPHSDSDLISYGASVPEFKASVWMEPHCSASRIKLSEDDPYDFYITAAHCIEDLSNEVKPEIADLYKELVADGIFDFQSISYNYSDNSIQGKSYDLLVHHDMGEMVLKWHALVRAAIDIGLIEICPSSVQDLSDIINSHISRSSSIGDADRIVFNNLKCIVHPNYDKNAYNGHTDGDNPHANKDKEEDDDDESFREESTGEDEEGTGDDEIDLALCTAYTKNANLPKYKLKFIKNFKEVKGEKLVSVSFGVRNTGNQLLNMVSERQAFNTLVGPGWEPQELGSIEGLNASISDSPSGFCESGDSGGTLLYRDNDGTYALIAVTEASSGGYSHWTILDPQFIADAYEQLIQDYALGSQKTEL